jgi:hypothetical protein
MRAVLVVVAFAACTPSIAPGAYLCGGNASCPPDQVCDGVTDSCVLKGTDMPFTCDMGTEVPGDDTPATAKQIPQLACVSPPYNDSGCMPAGDAQDWVKLATPSVCTSVAVQARLTYPVAYERLSLELWDLSTMTMLGSDVPCAQSANDPAHVERCITLQVNPGGDYGMAVKATSDGDCGGGCAYNRYDLTVQLATPG